MEGEIASKFLAAVLADKQVRGLLSDEHFSVDGTLLEAWASPKSFARKTRASGHAERLAAIVLIEPRAPNKSGPIAPGRSRLAPTRPTTPPTL